MAAAAAGAGSGATAATVTMTTTSRFAAACGALSRYVKAAEMARVSRPLPLMPGADVDDAASESREEAQDAGPVPSQLTIVYGGRVLVLDDVPADKAAGLLQVAAAAVAARGAKTTDLPVARKASLQRFMEKRKDRVAARREPYLRPGAHADRGDELTLAL